MSTTAVDGDNNLYLLYGKFYKPLLILAVLIVISQMIQNLHNIIDMLWIGHVGLDTVSATSFSFPIIFLMISVTAGFSTVGMALISQNTGARIENDQTNQIALKSPITETCTHLFDYIDSVLIGNPLEVAAK